MNNSSSKEIQFKNNLEILTGLASAIMSNEEKYDKKCDRTK